MTFEEFVAHRLGALLRFATAVTCDPHLAEDVVQDVLVRAQGRWRHIGSMAAPEAYVRRMVLNEFLSWRRRRTNRLLSVSTASLERLSGPVQDHAVRHGERDALLRLVATLPPRQRAAVALRYYADLSDQEIADELGCRAVTVRTQISRALATLRGVLPGRLIPTLERQQ